MSLATEPKPPTQLGLSSIRERVRQEKGDNSELTSWESTTKLSSSYTIKEIPESWEVAAACLISINIVCPDVYCKEIKNEVKVPSNPV